MPLLAVVARGKTFSVILVLVVYGRTDALLLPPSYLASLPGVCSGPSLNLCRLVSMDLYSCL